jgi:hypothetical protein
MKIGDRVKERDLGEGVVVETSSDMDSLNLVMVLFDKTPPLRYNMGENPTAVWKSDLAVIKGV